MSASYTSQTARIRVSKEISDSLVTVRVPGPVQTLVVVTDELPHVHRKAELDEHLLAPLGMALDDPELLVGQRTRLLEDRVGHRELADVVDECTRRQRPQAASCETELLAHLDGADGDSPGVLLRVLVLFGEAQGEGPDLSTEEGLFDGDEVGAGHVADQGARLRGATEVEGDRHSDDEEAEQLEPMSEPPAELHEVEEHGWWNGGGEPDDADGDDEVGSAAGEEEGSHRPEGQDREQGKPTASRMSAAGLPVAGTLGTALGKSIPTAPSKRTAQRSATWR